MHRSSTLTLVVPRLHGSHVDAFTPSTTDTSLIALIAGRGTLARTWSMSSADDARLEPWQRGLIAALGLATSDYPSASTTASNAHPGFADCLHAEPVHLVAGMNEVTLVPLQPACRLTEPERDSLTVGLREHLAIEGFELLTNAQGWLVGAHQPLRVETVCVHYAMRNDWSIVLPQGDDAGRLRRLMTEMQMLLHEHPVNEMRAARGVPIVNSVWLWGNGRVASHLTQSSAPLCFGSHEYLSGICKVNGWPTLASLPSPSTLIEQARHSQDVIALLNESTLDELDSRWLTPLVSALSEGHLARLRVVVDEWQITVDRWQLKKFWRRALPLAVWK